MNNFDISKSYDYIVNVLQKQGKALSFSQMYGDGTIFGSNKNMFVLLYTEILNELDWKAENDLV